MATAKKASVAAKIRGVLTLNPNAKVSVIAHRFNVSPAYVYQVKGKMDTPKTPKQQWKITDIVTSKEPTMPMKEEPKQPTNTDAMLADRGTRYGTFAGHARISQNIKDAIFGAMEQDKFDALAADQVEALEMIAHKIARIVNGDPNYADSWVDIGGYAKLVSDRLETGKEV
jgi:hypothetical protein